MSSHADPLRKDAAGNSGAASAIPAMATGNRLAGAMRVQSLASTGHMLNARPALVAQRAMAETLSRPPRAGATSIQRMQNGPPQQPVAAEQPAAPAALAGDQPVAANLANVAPPAQVGGGGNQPAAAAEEEDFGDFAVDFEAAFNGTSVATGAHTALNGPMYTTGLVNCVALVAYNPNTPLACLYHWNTADGGLRTEPDEDEAEDENGHVKTHCVADQAGITAAKQKVDGAVAGATVYHAVLGTGWDAAALAPVREAFVAMLEETFEDITVAAALHGSARWAAPDLTGY